MQHTKIVVYSTPSCPWCKKAKNYFSELGIKYKDIDVSKDREGAEKMVRKTGQMGAPVIEIGNHFIVGFDKNRIDKLLGTN